MLLQLKGIQKRFGGVVALKNGNLSVDSGEVHLLMGENGAGKSTLMKIVAGMFAADGGEMLWRGQPVSFRNPAEAQAHGIAMVHQECLLAPHLSVAENIFLGREARERVRAGQPPRDGAAGRRLIEEHAFPCRRLDRRKAQPRAEATGRDLPRDPARIEPADLRRAHFLALGIGNQEVFRIVRKLRERGMGVIYITHRLDELRSVGDRVTILRDGETVHTVPAGELTTAELIRHMVGREVTSIYQRAAC